MHKLLLLLLVIIGITTCTQSTFAAEITIKVVVESNLPPFQFLQDEGTVAGLHIDIMNEIARIQGWTVEYIPVKTTSQAIEAVKSGNADIILGFHSSEKLPEKLVLSNELASASISLIVERSHVDQLLHPTDSGQRYTTGFEFGTLTITQIAQLNARYTAIMGNQVQLFESLVAGDIDSIAAVKESFLYQLKHRAIPENKFTVVNNYMGTVRYALVVPQSDRVLLSGINSALLNLRYTGDYDKLVESWLPNIELIAAEGLIDKLVRVFLVVVGVAVLALFIIYYWNRKLKSIVEDKTAEIKQQMKNLEQESVLRNLLIEHAPNSILLVDASGSILHMNPRSKEVSEISLNNTTDASIKMDELSVFRTIWEETNYLSNQSMESSALSTIKDESGQERLFRYQYYVLNSENDKVLLVEDVTEEEQERTEAFEANKNQTLNRMIAGVAHEIKNPLTSIKAFAALIKDQAQDQDFQESFAKYVPPEVDRINRLIESLINYARPVRGLSERINLTKLIEECIQLTSPSADPRTQFRNFFTQSFWIRANRDQLKQVLINLLINAIESINEKLLTHPNELVSIATNIERNGKWIDLTIYDEGVGMSKDALKQCIEPFYSTKARGTGMGLSLAKQFVQENNGEFQIDSKEHEYTRVTITFEEDES